MLPGFNGFEVLRRVRAATAPAGRVPVLMLTARGDALDRIVGLEVGADDYLPKPFNERELVARIRAILRRAGATAAPPAEIVDSQRLRVGDVELEVGERRVRRGGREVELTGVEFDLLALLLRHAGKVVLRPEVSRQVLDRQLLPFDRSIDTHMSNLRASSARSPAARASASRQCAAWATSTSWRPKPAPRTSRPERRAPCKYLQPALSSSG